MAPSSTNILLPLLIVVAVFAATKEVYADNKYCESSGDHVPARCASIDNAVQKTACLYEGCADECKAKGGDEVMSYPKFNVVIGAYMNFICCKSKTAEQAAKEPSCLTCRLEKQIDAIEENGHIWRVKDINGFLRVLTDDTTGDATHSVMEITNKGVNKQSLKMTYLKAIVIQLLGNTKTTNKLKILNIGLGGGELANFLPELDPTMDITSVEISPAIINIATKYFGYKQGKNQRVINKDGIAYLHQATIEGNKFNWIIIDACDATAQPDAPLICPVNAFIDSDIARIISHLITEKGVLVINTYYAVENSSEVKQARMALKQAYGSHFNDCYFIDSGTNIIFTCLKESSGKKMNKKQYEDMVKGIRPIAGSWAKQLLKTINTVFMKEL